MMKWEKPKLIDLSMATFQASCNAGTYIEPNSHFVLGGQCAPVGSGASIADDIIKSDPNDEITSGCQEGSGVIGT